MMTASSTPALEVFKALDRLAQTIAFRHLDFFKEYGDQVQDGLAERLYSHLVAIDEAAQAAVDIAQRSLGADLARVDGRPVIGPDGSSTH